MEFIGYIYRTQNQILLMNLYFRYFILTLTFSLLLSSCKSDKLANRRSKDFMPPMEIAIDPAIKDDPELVEMVQSSEKAINQLSDNMEQLAIDGKDLLKKLNKEEGSLGDLLRAGKLASSFRSNSSEIIVALKQFETYMSKRKEGDTITDEQIEALDQVGEAFKARFEALSKKYEHLLDELN